MRAVVFEEFGGTPQLRDVPDPAAPAHGAVLRVTTTGLCRSDWHGWKGHDPEIRLPHVPGHEFAGVVLEVGAAVRRWRAGQRVTSPFVFACGDCPQCVAGDGQVCPNQTQAGFTHWGSFADYVVVDNADVNLVPLPDEISDAAAAALGCRFATAFRAVVTQGRVAAGEWVAVHGCGGVGLSAVMIAAAAGARVVAVDIAPGALELARTVGAVHTVDSSAIEGPTQVAEAIHELTGGGSHLSLDALGSHTTCVGSIQSLRRRGRHIQVGLLPPSGGRPSVPMDLVIAYELELLGSHGMPAHAYPQMLALVSAGVLRPDALVTRTISMHDAPAALSQMDRVASGGVTIIRP